MQPSVCLCLHLGFAKMLLGIPPQGPQELQELLIPQVAQLLRGVDCTGKPRLH
eukprot:CAMPEP_0204001040 /NCGR_PEP_ID=MMETSP0360-20130528/15825_1 /ASSEMBLY_ACC=CAM_ASM_000342 /TAXON_ID=268821 /ORGANISM="Scrippsiella Hangoei, Strain SHTV-5" /LENGTH=52 /DNA_ID=CAMNT_0050942449 /DNA_START=209 /DNA_END=364 /DNA_ORIENTATION=+